MNQKRIFVISALLFLFLAGELLAQPAMKFSKLKNANWGQLINCSCTKSLLLTDSGTGEALIEAGKKSTVRVSITYPSVLDQNNGSDTIDYSTPKAAYNVGANDKSTATAFSGDQAQEDIQTSRGSTGGDIYIYIYGDLTLSFNNADTYSGTVTIDAVYL